MPASSSTAAARSAAQGALAGWKARSGTARHGAAAAHLHRCCCWDGSRERRAGDGAPAYHKKGLLRRGRAREGRLSPPAAAARCPAREGGAPCLLGAREGLTRGWRGASAWRGKEERGAGSRVRGSARAGGQAVGGQAPRLAVHAQWQFQAPTCLAAAWRCSWARGAGPSPPLATSRPVGVGGVWVPGRVFTKEEETWAWAGAGKRV